ncbi:hypothetical protein CR513_05796, partial [Mucuna pruriens]
MKLRREKEKKRRKGEERKKMREKKERRMWCSKGPCPEEIQHPKDLECWRASKISSPRTSHVGATLPSQDVYKANPKESKEIQQQVGKLMEKGWVRESTSLCVVLVILVPKKEISLRGCVWSIIQ